MKLILLGTGTSTGIPEVGCGCGLCLGNDPRDKRLRTSALLVTNEGKRILIDAGPDLREQALRIGLDRVDAILLTHEHYDHVYGLDDLRTIAWSQSIPIFGDARVLEAVRQRMHYVFGEKPYPGTPRFELREIIAGEAFDLFGLRVKPFEVMHGSLPILAYRFDDEVAYVTDMKSISESSLQELEGLRVLVINALRALKPHPSHQSIRDVEELIAGLEQKPEQVILTHLSHHAPSHSILEHSLKAPLSAGYDFAEVRLGQEIEIRDFERDMPPYEYKELGRIAYADAWELQHQLFDSILAQKAEGKPTDSYLLLCEHNPVFTLGRNGNEANVLQGEEYLREQGFDFFRVERGGDITYHGPGQLTGYPILDLERYGLGLRTYIELLEEVVIELLDRHGIQSTRREGATGVWLDIDQPHKMRKICAIGVRSSRYVTMHGFALNVNNDLSPFSLINPCGFKEGKVTSMREELGYTLDFTTIQRFFTSILSERLRQRMPSRLDS